LGLRGLKANALLGRNQALSVNDDYFLSEQLKTKKTTYN
jgi:hypothetical protein